MTRSNNLRRATAAVLALIAVSLGLVAAAGSTAGADESVTSPQVTVTPNTDLDPTGQTVTIEGTGFGEGLGVYVRLCAAADGAIGTAAGRPGADRCLSSPQHWVAATSPPATATMSPEGSFSVTLDVSRFFDAEGRFDCAAVQCGIATRRDHVGGASDYTLDTFTPVSFDADPYFTDVPTSHPFFDEIQWMYATEISTGGFSGGQLVYQPRAAVKRQAMAAFLYRIAGEPALEEPGSPIFDDIGTDHPFFEAIQWMGEEGISLGVADPDGDGVIFKPNDVVRRKAMAAFLHRFFGETEPSGEPIDFVDVPASHQFFDAIAWMSGSGISTGGPNPSGPGTVFQPDAPVLRQAMAAFLYRMGPVPS